MIILENNMSIRNLLERSILNDTDIISYIFEAESNNPIDQELAKTADSVEKIGSLDQEDIDVQDDLEISDTDPDGFGDLDDVLDSIVDEPVDPEIMSQLQGHDYVTKYDHTDEETETNPIVIMSMDHQELTELRKQVRIYLDKVALTDRVGSYSSPETRAAQDLLAFVDEMLTIRKKEVKDQEKKLPNKPKVKQDTIKQPK